MWIVLENPAIPRADVQDTAQHPPADDNTNLAASAAEVGFFMRPPYSHPSLGCRSVSSPKPRRAEAAPGLRCRSCGVTAPPRGCRAGLCRPRLGPGPAPVPSACPAAGGFPTGARGCCTSCGHAYPFACRSGRCRAGGGHRQDCKVRYLNY